jgi:hypothetical protein
VASVQQLLRQLFVRSLLLATFGLVAIGLSGVVAVVIDARAGDSFVASDADDVRYPTGRCAEFHEDAPAARTCAAAASLHHMNELVVYRSAAGVVGVLGLLALAAAHRRRPQWFVADRLPIAFTDTVAAVAFGLAMAGQFALAADAIAHGGQGAGQWLSGGTVAAVGATIAVLRSTRRMARRPT